MNSFFREIICCLVCGHFHFALSMENIRIVIFIPKVSIFIKNISVLHIRCHITPTQLEIQGSSVH